MAAEYIEWRMSLSIDDRLFDYEIIVRWRIKELLVRIDVEPFDHQFEFVGQGKRVTP